LDVRPNVGYDCDLRQPFMPSWKKSQLAGGIAKSSIAMSTQQPQLRLLPGTAATDFMPAIAGSLTLQLLLRRGRDDAWLDLFQQGINSAHGCRRSVRPPVLRCARGHLSAVLAAPKPAKLALFYSGANSPGLVHLTGPLTACASERCPLPILVPM
jgi:hypothetical protein